MNIKKLVYSIALIFAFGASSMTFAADKIDADDFVDEASAKGLGEIDNAKLALEKSNSADVKAFARKIIADHSAANLSLAGIASQKNLEVSDETELMAKAKSFVLKQRDGESFDEAYANNQVEAHKDAIELFQRATVSDDADIAAFAKKTLPKLQQHLQEAKQLAAAHDDQ